MVFRIGTFIAVAVLLLVGINKRIVFIYDQATLGAETFAGRKFREKKKSRN